MTDIEKTYELNLKFTELRDKYFLNKIIEVISNMNRYGKSFLRVNIYLPNDDITQTFNWSELGYKKAVDFIEKWERRIKNNE